MTTTLMIYDEIVEPFEQKAWGIGISAESFAMELDKAAPGDIELRINSPGGDVNNGLAIYNLLLAQRAQGRKVVCYIDGAAHSAASVIAMAGDEVRMARCSSMLIHQPWAFAIGNADDMRAAADSLDMATAKIMPAYTQKTGMGDEAIRALLVAETELLPDMAKAMKFADLIDEPPEREMKAWAADRVRHPLAKAALQALAKKTSSRPAAVQPEEKPMNKDIAARIKAKAEQDPDLKAFLAEQEQERAQIAAQAEQEKAARVTAQAQADQLKYEELIRGAKDPKAPKILGPAHEDRIRAAYKTPAELEKYLGTVEPAKALSPERPDTATGAGPLSTAGKKFMKALKAGGVEVTEAQFQRARASVRAPRIPEEVN